MMLWQSVKSILKKTLSENDIVLWIEPLSYRKHDEQALDLAGPDRYFCNWVVNNYASHIQAALKDLGHSKMRVRLAVDGRPAACVAPAEAEQKQEQLRLPLMPANYSTVRTLHPRFTFEEFMVGESNALAHSACEAIALGQDILSPCVYVKAGTGLGKSHLTHAVAHHILKNSPGTRMHYMTSQKLTAEMVRCIKDNAMETFKDKYHNQCDVLLVDDVQSLAGKNKTQAELAETLDVLMETGKKVIFTGSIGPREIPDISEGIRSRMSSGLITSINPPDQYTRKLIVERKAKNNKLHLPEEVVIFLAENLKGDIRRIESIIVGLKARAAILKKDPDLDLVKEIIGCSFGQQAMITAEAIRDFVADQFNVAVDDMQSKSRKKMVAFPRQISMYLARQLTEQGLSEIGQAFNRDHSTVVHSIRVITEAMVRNGSVRGQVEHLAERLKKQSR